MEVFFRNIIYHTSDSDHIEECSKHQNPKQVFYFLKFSCLALNTYTTNERSKKKKTNAKTENLSIYPSNDIIVLNKDFFLSSLLLPLLCFGVAVVVIIFYSFRKGYDKYFKLRRDILTTKFYNIMCAYVVNILASGHCSLSFARIFLLLHPRTVI